MRNLLARLTDDVSRRFLLLGASHLLGGVLGFAATLVAVKTLGDAGFGALALGLSLQAYAFVFVAFGTDIGAVREAAQEPERLGEILARVTALRLAIACMAFLGLSGLAVSGIWSHTESLVIAGFAISPFLQALYPLWAPQALERTGLVAAIAVLGPAANLALALLAAAAFSTPLAFAGAKIGMDLLLAVSVFAWTRRQAGPLAWRQTPGEIRAEATRISPLGFGQLLRSAMISFDLVVLSLFFSVGLVGQFAVAFRIYLFLIALSSMYFVVLLPVFSRILRSAGHAGLGLELRNSLIRTVPVVLLATGTVALFSAPILGLLFGEDFRQSAWPLSILMAGVAANFLHRTYRQVLLAAGETRTDLSNGAAALVLKVTAMTLLVPLAGPVGSALAVLAGDGALLVLQRRAALRTIRRSDEAG